MVLWHIANRLSKTFFLIIFSIEIPPYVISPSYSSNWRSNSFKIVVLPEPVLPTIPNVSPACNSNETFFNVAASSPGNVNECTLNDEHSTRFYIKCTFNYPQFQQEQLIILQFGHMMHYLVRRC